MQRPFNDAERINQRLDGVGLVVCQTNRDFISDVVKLLRHVHDLPRTLLRIKKVEATYVDWCRLQSTLEAALGVCEQMSHFTQQGDKAEDHRQYIDGLLSPISTQSVYQAHQLVTHAIDTKESFSTQSVVIRHGYDAQLDHERELFENLESELTEAAHRVLEQVPLLQHVSVEYVPQIGYLVAVNRSEIHFLDTVSETDHRNTTALGGGTDAYAQVDTEMWSDSNAGRNYQNPVPSTAATAGTHYANQWEGQQNYQQPLDWNNFENEENGVHNDSPYHKKQRQQQYQSQSQPQSQAPIHSTTSPFQFVYAQEDIHYFKHAIVYELDESIGDIKSIIVDHQKQLLLKLEDDILDQEPSIQQVALMLANLDALISLGTIAFEMKLTRPQIVDDNVIVIKNGRHPLQELTVDCFVPNDTYLTVNKNIALITGPNSSGKSVYLKQVGMMVYLAHLGSWLPCDKAAIGLTDRIFTRIASLESNSNQFSSFSLDLNQVSKMLSQHTSRSLCLIDEFGKGTSPIDGIALLAAVINHFAEKKAKSVFVLHFTEALHPDVLSPAATACVSTFRMDTYTRPIEDFEVDALNSREEVLAQRGQSGSITGGRVSTADSTGYGAYDPTPLFKLRVGVSPSSEGIPCARNAGIPEHILTRAAVIKQCVTTKQAIHPVPTQRASILNNVNVHRLLTIFLMVKDWTVMLYNRIGGSTVTATATGGADQVNSIAEGSADGNNPSTNTNTSSSGTEGVTNFSLLQELKQLIRSHI